MYKVTIEKDGKIEQQLEADFLILATNSKHEDTKTERHGFVSVLGMNDLNDLVFTSLLIQNATENILKTEILRNFPEQFAGLNEQEVQISLRNVLLDIYEQAYKQLTKSTMQSPISNDSFH